MSSTTFLTALISALIGGIVSAIFYPLIKYQLIRKINSWGIKIELRQPDSSPDNSHISLPLKISNSSPSSIKNVVAFIYLEYQTEDIMPTTVEPNILTHKSNNAYQWTLLSWAKVVDAKILAERTLNQGEYADLNVFRFHPRGHSQPAALEVASEQGFYRLGTDRIGRVLLTIDKDYLFKIRITADNLVPIDKSFRYIQIGNCIEGF